MCSMLLALVPAAVASYAYVPVADYYHPHSHSLAQYYFGAPLSESLFEVRKPRTAALEVAMMGFPAFPEMLHPGMAGDRSMHWSNVGGHALRPRAVTFPAHSIREDDVLEQGRWINAGDHVSTKIVLPVTMGEGNGELSAHLHEDVLVVHATRKSPTLAFSERIELALPFPVSSPEAVELVMEVDRRSISARISKAAKAPRPEPAALTIKAAEAPKQGDLSRSEQATIEEEQLEAKFGVARADLGAGAEKMLSGGEMPETKPHSAGVAADVHERT